MSKEYKNVAIDGIDQWLYLIKKFNQSPKEALETMHEHNQDVASVIEYIDDMLTSFTFNPMDRKKLGKVKDLLDKERKEI